MILFEQNLLIEYVWVVLSKLCRAVSTKTVEAWEAGRNIPDGPARRMLSMLKQDPSIPEKYRFVERKSVAPSDRKSSRRTV